VIRMTTTEPSTVAEFDEQIGRLDTAHVTLTAQLEGIQVELGAVRAEWTDRAALGDVDGELTTRLKGYQASLESVDTAIAINRAKREEVVTARRELAGAQQTAADRAAYEDDVRAFAGRLSASALSDRLLDTVYAAVRATVAEQIDLHTEQQRLDAEAQRFPGAPTPPDLVTVDFAPDIIGRVPNRISQQIRVFRGWAAEQRVAAAVADYLKDRIWVSSRDNPTEPVPPFPGQQVSDHPMRG
jgi:hypothetical protein